MRRMSTDDDPPGQGGPPGQPAPPADPRSSRRSLPPPNRGAAPAPFPPRAGSTTQSPPRPASPTQSPPAKQPAVIVDEAPTARGPGAPAGEAARTGAPADLMATTRGAA